MFASYLLSKFMHNSSKVHFGAAKGVLRYIKGTSNYGIRFDKGVRTILFGYCDSDWDGHYKKKAFIDNNHQRHTLQFEFIDRTPTTSVCRHFLTNPTKILREISRQELTTRYRRFSLSVSQVSDEISDDSLIVGNETIFPMTLPMEVSYSWVLKLIGRWKCQIRLLVYVLPRVLPSTLPSVIYHRR